MVYTGIDVSAVQGNVDFQWVKNKGFSFVICRNYVGNDINSRDAYCDISLKKSKDFGLYTAIYNFPFILPTDNIHKNRDPESQAELHFQNTPAGELVCVDAEWPSPDKWSQWNIPNGAFLDDWLNRYLEKYKQLSGLKTEQIVIYTYPYFAKAINFRSDLAKYPLWIASYETNPQIPQPWTDWTLWQTAGGTQLTLPNGIATDTDVAKDLSLWNIITPPSVVNPVVQAPITIQPIQTPIQALTPTTTPSPTKNLATTINTILDVINPLFPAILKLVKTLFHIK